MQAAYLRVIGRKPEAGEVGDALQMMKDLSKGNAQSRWAIFIQALMSSAEVRYVL